MGEGTRVVDYGRDIADLRKFVVALQGQVNNLEGQVERLQKRLEDSGALYGGTIAYGTQQVPVDGFKTKFNY